MLLIILSVLLSEGLRTLRDFVQSVYRRRLTNWNARATIDAFYRADKKLRYLGILRFILARVNAIHRTNLYALLILGAIPSDYVSHESMLLRAMR